MDAACQQVERSAWTRASATGRLGPVVPIVGGAYELLACERACKASCRRNCGSIKKIEHDPDTVVSPPIVLKRGRDPDYFGVRGTDQHRQRARVVGVAREVGVDVDGSNHSFTLPGTGRSSCSQPAKCGTTGSAPEVPVDGAGANVAKPAVWDASWSLDEENES